MRAQWRSDSIIRFILKTPTEGVYQAETESINAYKIPHHMMLGIKSITVRERGLLFSLISMLMKDL